MELKLHEKILVHQVFEGAELFGFETRNKYEILSERGQPIGYAAEQQKGLSGFFLRQFLGHWRVFTIKFFDSQRNEIMHAIHPFRFIFQRFEIRANNGEYIGCIQQRFSILKKKFDILDKTNQKIMEMNSPIWKIWTFPFYKNGQEVGRVEKKWSGILAESFTDKDKFMISFTRQDMPEKFRMILLAASVFIDLQYFEKKANNN